MRQDELERELQLRLDTMRPLAPALRHWSPSHAVVRMCLCSQCSSPGAMCRGTSTASGPAGCSPNPATLCSVDLNGGPRRAVLVRDTECPVAVPVVPPVLLDHHNHLSAAITTTSRPSRPCSLICPLHLHCILAQSDKIARSTSVPNLGFYLRERMEPAVGFEPTTCCLQDRAKWCRAQSLTSGSSVCPGQSM